MREHTIFIEGPVGEGDIDPAVIGRQLEENPGPVRAYVNSPGGFAHAGVAIMGAFARHGRVICEVTGLAASAASLLIMGAQRIEMNAAAHLMIHNPANLVFGSAADLRAEADVLDKLAGTYAGAYSRATGHPVERIRAWMDAETWLTAEEALALNFCDAVIGTEPKPVAAFNYARFKSAPPALVQLAVQNGWTEKKDT